MKSRIEWERMISGRLYCPFRVGDDSAARVHAAQKRIDKVDCLLGKLRDCTQKA